LIRMVLLGELITLQSRRVIEVPFCASLIAVGSVAFILPLVTKPFSSLVVLVWASIICQANVFVASSERSKNLKGNAKARHREGIVTGARSARIVRFSSHSAMPHA